MTRDEQVCLKAQERIQLIESFEAQASMNVAIAYNILNGINGYRMPEEWIIDKAIRRLEFALMKLRRAQGLFRPESAGKTLEHVTAHFERKRQRSPHLQKLPHHRNRDGYDEE